MKLFGSLRRVDKHGRVTIPAGTRRELNIVPGDDMEIHTYDNRIILEKVERSCVFCGRHTGCTYKFMGKLVCPECLQAIRSGGSIDELFK